MFPEFPVVQMQIALRAGGLTCYKTRSRFALLGDCAMRVATCSLLGVLFLAMSASAQQESIDSVLRGWEKAMSNLDSFVAKVDRKTVDIALGGAVDEFKGYAMFQKTGKNESSRA